ncbi:hypothetical protein OEW28_04675 [Defluviimonas sp. WL0002]|uniref:Lipoprotein n=1 Tax=Albidovulum marisflavi TaxID=2984159 RepID=A0ABT2Z9V0_9RHOB|nr:hypothetical protein [Defluviimonas sp. WL0002]MCV2867913.1 hypothetical protein [Defluviimonas sp. WL0002]
MKVTIRVVLALAVLSGCVPTTATVSDYNGASVKVQTSNLAPAKEQMAVAQKEADRICAIGTSKSAEYASTRQLPDYVAEHLFLCL